MPNRFCQAGFSLKGLLTAVTIFALACWGNWVAWPRWILYCERLQFEASIKQIRSGALVYDIWGKLGHTQRGIRGAAKDANGNPVGWIQYDWPGAIYLVYCPLEQRAGGHPDYDLSLNVEVFRLAPTPSGYEPQTARGRDAMPDRAFAYSRDFFEYVSGDRQHNPGFHYELIHAAPARVD